MQIMTHDKKEKVVITVQPKKNYIRVAVYLDNFTTRKWIIKEKGIILGHKTETMLASNTSKLIFHESI